MQDLLKIVKLLEDSGILLKGVGETIQNKAKEQRVGFLSILLSTLGASFLGDVVFNRRGKGCIRAGYGSKNFEIQMYYQNESKFNGVYSRDNLPNRIKDGAYVINLDEYSNIETHWVALYVNKTVTYFDSFGVEHIPKEIKKFIGNRDITANIYKIQNYDSIKCGYFCIGFINFMFKGKSLTGFTNLFSPNN